MGTKNRTADNSVDNNAAAICTLRMCACILRNETNYFAETADNVGIGNNFFNAGETS